MGLTKGQMVLMVYQNRGQNADWEYGAIVNLFDGKVEIEREDTESNYMHILDDSFTDLISDQPTKCVVTPLTVNGKPVMSKKTIFGKYTFKPKN